MAYRVEMECTQTQVGDHSEIGYRSGERLPVGHPDVGLDWRPVVVEVPDAPPPPQVTADPPIVAHVKRAAPTAQTGVRQ